MKVTGKARIFKNEKGNYSTSISNKKEDGTYENMYVAVNLKKGIELENNTNIEITDGFLSSYKTKDGLCKVKIVVMEYVKILDNEVNYADGTLRQIDDNDLPF